MVNKSCLKLKKADLPDSDFDAKQLLVGTRIESEHTNNISVAKGIAKAHLAEDPNYYKKLKKIENGVKNAGKK